MTSRNTTLAFLFLLLFTACSKEAAPQAGAQRTGSVQEPTQVPGPPAGAAALAGTGLARLERKITRTADLDLQSDDPRGAQVAAITIAESLGGYVGTSDVVRDGRGEEDADLTLRMVLRVPSERFSVALERLKGLSQHVSGERINAEDVTEEFIDLNARIASLKALEAQFVEILKQARSVKDALEVHTQLAQVRTDIDKLEGRRQFLENQTSLSTIRLAVTRRPPVLQAGSFGVGVTLKQAAGDAVSTTVAIVHGVIRLLGFAVPILALLVLPVVLLMTALLRRARRARSLS
jgi:Domain of unknown function (DUF4349)